LFKKQRLKFAGKEMEKEELVDLTRVITVSRQAGSRSRRAADR